MANSTEVITDLHTLAGSTFTAASIAKARATDDPDLASMVVTAAAAGADLKRALRLIAANRPGRSGAHPHQQHPRHAFLKSSG